jgi:hypothetical protein
LEGGHTEKSIPELVEVAENVLKKYCNEPALSLFNDEQVDIMRNILGKLTKAAEVGLGLRHPEPVFRKQEFGKYLIERAKEINDLDLGDFLLWCGGWSPHGKPGHAIMYMVDRTSDREVSFVVFNTGEGVR